MCMYVLECGGIVMPRLCARTHSLYSMICIICMCGLLEQSVCSFLYFAMLECLFQEICKNREYLVVDRHSVFHSVALLLTWALSVRWEGEGD